MAAGSAGSDSLNRQLYPPSCSSERRALAGFLLRANMIGSDTRSMSDQEEPETEEQHEARLKAIVLGILDNTIFTDRHCRTLEDVRLAFAVLMFMDKMPEDVGMIYEHMDKAGPRGINGYPMFFSAHFVKTADAKRIWKAVYAEMERRKEIKV